MADLTDAEERWTTTHGDVVEVWRVPRADRVEDWRWHVQARNGEIVEQGEGYTRKESACAAAKRHHPYILDPDNMPDVSIEMGRVVRAQQMVQQVLRAKDLPVESWMVEFVARALEMEARHGA
jgi:hypothetical protein